MSSLRIFIDSWWTFVLPIICLASMLINVVNGLMLAKLRPIRPVYRRLFAKSVINSIYLFICMWKFVSKCGQFCELFYSARDYREKWSFWIQVYNFYLYGVVGRILAQCDLFIEILIALQRLRLLTSTCSGAFTSCLLTGTSIKLIVALSVLIYVPDVLFTRIVWHQSPSQQQPSHNASSGNMSTACVGLLKLETVNKELYEKVVGVKVLGLRFLLTVALVSLINAANCYQIRKKIQRIRHTNTADGDYFVTKASRLGHDVAQFNRMLMWQSMVYIVGNALLLVLLLLVLLRKVSYRDEYYDLYVVCANTPLFVSFGLTFAVYWRYDEKFRMQTRSFFQARFRRSYSFG